MPEQTIVERGGSRMQRRRVTLSDGRYLIFYTFGEEAQASASDPADGARSQPEAEPQATEEQGV